METRIGLSGARAFDENELLAGASVVLFLQPCSTWHGSARAFHAIGTGSYKVPTERGVLAVIWGEDDDVTASEVSTVGAVAKLVVIVGPDKGVVSKFCEGRDEVISLDQLAADAVVERVFNWDSKKFERRVLRARQRKSKEK